MKYRHLILSLVLCAIAYSNHPSLFITINSSENEKCIVIGSEIIWDIGYVPFDEAEHFRKNDYYFHGDDQEFREVIWIDNTKTEIIAYFPRQLNGRKLVETTTAHLTIKINDKEVFYSEHFGQYSEFYVTKEFGILPRPQQLSLDIADVDNTTISVQGMLGETKLENGNFIDQQFEILYNLEKTKKRIDDEKLAQDEEQFKKTLKWDLTTYAVNETLDMFYMERKAYQTLDFFYIHRDDYETTSEDWLTAIDLRIKPLKSSSWIEKLIAVDYKLVKNEGKEFLRIYDPRFSIYSNLVKLHDQNSVVNMEQRTMTLKNKKHNTILEGIDVLNPIKRKKVKIVFHHQHIIKSIKVEPSSIIKEMDENTITFSGEGMENLAYEIEFGFVPYETYEPKKEDLSASTIKLTPDEHYFIFVKSDKGNMINVYVNDMLFSESLPIDQNEKAIPPYVMKNNIIGNVIIENAGQVEANIHLLIKDTKQHTIKQQKFSIKKGIAKKINFEY